MLFHSAGQYTSWTFPICSIQLAKKLYSCAYDTFYSDLSRTRRTQQGLAEARLFAPQPGRPEAIWLVVVLCGSGLTAEPVQRCWRGSCCASSNGTLAGAPALKRLGKPLISVGPRLCPDQGCLSREFLGALGRVAGGSTTGAYWVRSSYRQKVYGCERQEGVTYGTAKKAGWPEPKQRGESLYWLEYYD